MFIEGNFVDVLKGEIYPAKITFSKTIQKIERTNKTYSTYISPGLIDAHIRIEDSFLNPIEYTNHAILSGVTCVVEDISGFFTSAGAEGIKYLLTTFSKMPLSFHYLFPINLEHSKIEGSPKDLSDADFFALVKQKQFLGVTQVDDSKRLHKSEVSIHKKLLAVKEAGKPLISNIPKIPFTDINTFTEMGVRADLGSNIYQEAFEKACFGLKIKIVEGTKRKTLAGLIRLSKQFDTIIVSEEKSAAEISKGYLKTTLKKAVSLGLDPITAIQNVTSNPAKLLNLSEGVLEEGSIANIVEFEDLKSFDVKRVFINGEQVLKSGKVALKNDKITEPRMKIELDDISVEDIKIESEEKEEKVTTIIAKENLETEILEEVIPVKENEITSDIEKDILKCVVVSKYGEGLLSISFIKGFKLEKGAIATTLYATSGNFIAIGTNDEDIVTAINELKRNKGGIIAVEKKRSQECYLNILGVVSSKKADEVHEEIKKTQQFVRRLGCQMQDPFYVLGNLMNLNKKGIRLTDKGVFNTETAEQIQILKE